MLIALSIIAILILTVFFYLRHPKFGQKPSGKRLETIQKSPNYRDGKFQNLHHTPDLTEGYTLWEVIAEFLFKKAPRQKPTDPIPSTKTDLLHLPLDADVLVWFGHSSYFLQVDGKRFLVDPVLSGNAAPIAGSNKAFKGTDRYTVDDLPTIDYLLITHDHYDHMDYETLLKLRPKAKLAICGLGVGAHLEHWGYPADSIIERDWNKRVELGNGFVLYTTPARHFSGRSFSRCNTLWMSFVLQTPTMKLYLGGDSGYDSHFTEIGNEHGPFDLALLDNGQYDIKWKYIHMMPDEVLKAAKDLRTKRLFPVHSGKFVLANHPWDEPLVKVTELSKVTNIPLLTPMIGERVNLKDAHQSFKQWWVGVS